MAFGFFKKIGEGFKKAGKWIGNTAKKAYNATKKVVKKVGQGVVKAGKFVGENAVKVGKYAVEHAPELMQTASNVMQMIPVPQLQGVGAGLGIASQLLGGGNQQQQAEEEVPVEEEIEYVDEDGNPCTPPEQYLGSR